MLPGPTTKQQALTGWTGSASMTTTQCVCFSQLTAVQATAQTAKLCELT